MGKHSLRDWNQRQLDKREKKRQKYFDIREREWLKYATTETFTIEVYLQDVDELLSRGWVLVQYLSQGFSGTTKAILKTTKTELAGRVNV
jgi:hypothetical protein